MKTKLAEQNLEESKAPVAPTADQPPLRQLVSRGIPIYLDMSMLQNVELKIPVKKMKRPKEAEHVGDTSPVQDDVDDEDAIPGTTTSTDFLANSVAYRRTIIQDLTILGA